MITHIFHSTIVSGPETLVLTALARLGEPVSVVFLDEKRVPGGADGPVAYARSLGLETRTVPVQGRWDRKAFAQLAETLQSLGTQIAHAHDVKASLYLQQARGYRGKRVSTHHGAAARAGLIRLYEEIYVRWTLPRFDAVLCVCKADYASLTRRGVLPEILSVHYNGVDRLDVVPQARAGRQAEIRRTWGVEEGVLVIGAVARLSQEKRHDRMIRALRAAREAGAPKAVLLCFGIGAEEAKLKALTAELGMEREVRWMGYSKTIGQEMAGFDLLLCLSDGEGIPINLIEAGWSGTPVLSTSVGGIPDLLEESVGYLVSKQDSDDAIGKRLADILRDAGSRHTVGARFRERVRDRFSERAWLDQLRAVYARLR